MAFSAKKEESSFLVIKSLQHPARIYDTKYAERVGQSIRDAAMALEPWQPATLVNSGR